VKRYTAPTPSAALPVAVASGDPGMIPATPLVSAAPTASVLPSELSAMQVPKKSLALVF
jgi:hypothetical protein